MAMIFEVEYPNGERAWSVGFPGGTLVIDLVPPGPQSCLGDQLEVEFRKGEPCRVLRVLGGPRRPTIRVRVPGGVPAREAWMTAREAEGWATADGLEADPDIVWVAATRDGLDPAGLSSNLSTVLPEETGPRR
ncbi:MAG: hypothetical protein GQE15_30910 [Archangiaceae bacterium]|nr:hypothetical protein [Archangiaceae bacterium]